jgi:DnaJ-class molecular chaperone
LVYNAQISLVEALIGFSKRLTLPLGDRIVVEHDGVTSNAYRKVYEGHGLPKMGSAERGNLVVEFDVQFPTRLSNTQRKALAVVMDDDELVMLEAVIRLAAIKDQVPMAPAEHVWGSSCSVDPSVCEQHALANIFGFAF